MSLKKFQVIWNPTDVQEDGVSFKKYVKLSPCLLARSFHYILDFLAIDAEVGIGMQLN